MVDHRKPCRDGEMLREDLGTVSRAGGKVPRHRETRFRDLGKPSPRSEMEAALSAAWLFTILGRAAHASVVPRWPTSTGERQDWESQVAAVTGEHLRGSGETGKSPQSSVSIVRTGPFGFSAEDYAAVT